MENKSRIAWFSIFYIILFLFGIYNLIFLVIIWENHELFRLYTQGFTAINDGKTMSGYSSSFAIYGLVTIGTVFAFFGILGAILSQTLVSIADTPRKKLAGLIVGFVLVIIGFYFAFIAQLYYYEWNDSTITIIQRNTIEFPASHFYQHWLNLVEIWSIFAVFLLLLIICIFLIVKLHQKNLDWTRYKNANHKEELNLEITAPLSNTTEFDPNETETITLNLDATDKVLLRKKKRRKLKRNK